MPEHGQAVAGTCAGDKEERTVASTLTLVAFRVLVGILRDRGARHQAVCHRATIIRWYSSSLESVHGADVNAIDSARSVGADLDRRDAILREAA